jgi:uncharacterized protein (TIGR02246 family)
MQSYVAAFNRHDVNAIAAHWAEDGRLTMPKGTRINGWKAIERFLADQFAAHKGASLELSEPTLRFFSPEVVENEGSARTTTADGPKDFAYRAFLVKRAGMWRIADLHVNNPATSSFVQAEAPARNPLLDLEWLIGSWSESSGDSTIETEFEWAKNRRFITEHFRVAVKNGVDIEGTQVIGWDPIQATIRSWVFDSEGGFGEGVWSREGNRWIVRTNGVLPDGRRASAVHVYRKADDERYGWRSIARKVDNNFLPNIDEAFLTRKSVRR